MGCSPAENVTFSLCHLLFLLKSELCGTAEPWQESAPFEAKGMGADRKITIKLAAF